MLCISTSKRVLRTPLDGRNRLSDAKTTFPVTNGKINNAPLWDLFWKTEVCRPEDLRGGCFSIQPETIDILYLNKSVDLHQVFYA